MLIPMLLTDTISSDLFLSLFHLLPVSFPESSSEAAFVILEAVNDPVVSQ